MRYAKYIAVCFALLALVFLLGYNRGKRAVMEGLKPSVDTLYLADTIRVDSPIPARITPIEPMDVKIPLSVSYLLAQLPDDRDTVRVVDRIHDTVMVDVSLPRERRLYENQYYRAVVSGVQPRLDSIALFYTTKVVNNPVYIQPDPNRLFLDASLSYGGRFSAPVTLNYGYSFRWLELYGGAGYDFAQKGMVCRVGARANLLTWK